MVSGAPWANKDVSFYVFAPHRVSSQSHLLSLMELIVHLGCQANLRSISFNCVSACTHANKGLNDL